MIPTVAPYLLPSALPRLRARNLSLDLGVREAQTDRLIEEVREGALDAAVVALPVRTPGLVAAPLFEDRFLLAGSPAGWRRWRRGGAALHPRTWRPGSFCSSTTAIAWPTRRWPPARSTAPAGRMDLRAASLDHALPAGVRGVRPDPAARARRPGRMRRGARRSGSRASRRPSPGARSGWCGGALSVDDGWFGELAAILAEAGRAEIAQRA